jgi:hypothetical protein
MLISNLEHLNTLTEASDPQGGDVGNGLSLSFSKGILSLKLNDKELYTTPLASLPSTINISLDNVPNLQSFYKLENINGVIRSSWILSSSPLSINSSIPSGIFAFASSSTGNLPI